MKKIDLHIHSTASDGTYFPSDIVKMAEELDLAAIALTDHDTVDGIPEFLSAGKKSAVDVIPGVEIAAVWNFKEVHILGLWIDQDNFELNELLRKVRKNRDKRNYEILGKLKSSGFDISIEEVENEAKGVIGRMHIAALLVKKKYFKTIKDVFEKCLARGSQCYVPRILSDITEAVSAIHKAGGISIWAHSMHRNKTNVKNVKSDIIHFMTLGLDGIEAYYPEYTEKQHKLLLEYASELNIPITGGTDFHGENIPDIKMAVGKGSLFVPETVYADLKSYCQNKMAKISGEI